MQTCFEKYGNTVNPLCDNSSRSTSSIEYYFRLKYWSNAVPTHPPHRHTPINRYGKPSFSKHACLLLPGDAHATCGLCCQRSCPLVRPPIGNGLWWVEWSRDRWRHATQKGQVEIPIHVCPKQPGMIFRNNG